MKGKIFNVPFRRKREGRTHYKKRLKVLLSNKFRFVIRKSLKNLQVLLIEYKTTGDKVLFTVDSKSIVKLGWKLNSDNLPSAYLIGYIAGKKAIEIRITEAVLDLGFYKPTKGSRLFAALAGAIDAGLKIPYNSDIIPPKDRISGVHIVNYAKLLKNDKLKYEKQFSNYVKKGINPEDIVNHFNEVKSKING